MNGKGEALRKNGKSHFFSVACFGEFEVAQVLLPAFLSAPQGVSVPGLPGMRTTRAAQQSRLADECGG